MAIRRLFSFRAARYMEPGIPEKKPRSVITRVAAAIVILILLVTVAYFALPSLVSLGRALTGVTVDNSTSTYMVNGNNASGANDSTIEITFPPAYNTLANFSLSIINENRTAFGLSTVIQSPILSAQQHADSMLQNGYFSHWDTQGYKPYMRYTMLNGTGYVEENVASEITTLPAFTSTHDVELAISDLEWQMVYNDSACCDNGHRVNILSAFHNRVSIGIAYDATHVYFVEDFENYYANLSTPIAAQDGVVALDGTTSQPLDPTSVWVLYDPTPQPITSQALNTNSDYDGPYTQGTFVGGVVPPCNNIFGECAQFASGITVHATVWNVATDSVDIKFSLANFVSEYGNGVYTISLVQGNDSDPEFLTSYSVFVSG
jgi:hypothetical protein